MPIPADFVRFGWNFNARGSSGTRTVTIAVNYVPTVFAPAIGTPAFFTEGAVFLNEVWQDELRTGFAVSTTLESVSLSVAGGGGSVSIPSGTSGARTGLLMPPEMAGIVQLRTDLPGRRGRGRMFLPDVLEADVDQDGVVSAGASNAWSTAVGNMLGEMDNNVTSTAFAASCNGAHILHSNGSPPTRITGLGVNSRPGWLRRRGR